MKVGYARTSTLEQQAGFEAQIREVEDMQVRTLLLDLVGDLQQVLRRSRKPIQLADSKHVIIANEIERRF